MDPSWDCSYYDFLKEVRRFPPNRFAARQLAWEDYVAERTSEILSLAKRYTGETHVYNIATPQGGVLSATISDNGPNVDIAVWWGEKNVYECTGLHSLYVLRDMPEAIICEVTRRCEIP
jgi:hypothetical protein